MHQCVWNWESFKDYERKPQVVSSNWVSAIGSSSSTDSNPNDELYPNKNLCVELKTKVNAKRPSNLEELDRFTEEEWAGIDQEMTMNYNKQLQAAIQQKGYTIYY